MISKRRNRKMRYAKTFGEKVRSRRKFIKMTEEKLAELSGVDRTYISKIEHGKCIPDIQVAERISQAFNDEEIIRIFLRYFYPHLDRYYKEPVNQLTGTNDIEVNRAVFESVVDDDMPDGAYFAMAQEFGLDPEDLIDD